MPRFLITILHIGYWLLYSLLLLFLFFLLSVLPTAGTKENHPGHFLFFLKFISTFAVIPAIISFYLFYSWLFKRFLAEKKYVLFFLLGILSSILAALIGGLVEVMLLYFNQSLYQPDIKWVEIITIIAFMSFNALINGIIATVIKGFISWMNDFTWKEQVAKKNIETELSLIKSKLDPHFLFNTLNNIDVLVEENSATASGYIKKLSEILRFTLYEAKSNLIPARTEIDYINKYLDLQRIRFANPGFIQLVCIGDYDSIELAPMIFMPFIENACKYAKRNKNKDAFGIRIQFVFSKLSVQFEIINEYDISLINQYHEGLGIALATKRLALLYPGKHQLIIDPHDEQFKVRLQIHLV